MSKSNNISEGTRTHMVRRDVFFRQKIKLLEYLIFPVCRYLSCDLSGTIPHPQLPTDSLPQEKKSPLVDFFCHQVCRHDLLLSTAAF